MTAIITRPLSDSTDSLLRFALRADATVCAGVGLLTAILADSLSAVAGLSATAGWVIGAALVGYGALLYVLAALPAIRKVGIAVASGNAVFAVAAVTAVLADWLPLTGAGVELLLGFVGATAVLAWLQYRGVRRLA
ncbi:hypothetical protein [Mycolicibacterium goodii]|uniref:Membrane protein n=1 Tax=Mycolicibacterium goodii TaxID=134601 RepID=A0A0K0X654_MYCGD|nr:membrane protein [Mycolicibacterium goodii]